MSVDLQVDMGGANYFLGYVDGISTYVRTPQYLDAAMNYTTAELGLRFELAMDRAAAGAPEKFHHVYEWGKTYGSRETVGVPSERLWRLVHAGTNGHRTVGFMFLPSKEPSPIEPELLVPGAKNRRKVNEGVHVFTWKAMVMEYGLPVKIKPKLAKKLLFVDPITKKIVATTKEITAFPGKDKVTGNFTKFYEGWWNLDAQAIFGSEIRKVLEERTVPRDAGGRFAPKSASAPKAPMEAISVGHTEYEYGKREAERKMSQARMNYIGDAARRRMDLYGY